VFSLKRLIRQNFLETVENILGEKVEIPAKLQEFMKGEKKNESMSKKFEDFKAYLLNTAT